MITGAQNSLKSQIKKYVEEYFAEHENIPGFNWNKVDSKRNTLLHLACYTQCHQQIRRLVDLVDVNLENAFGVTPFHFIAFNGDETEIKLFLDRGAKLLKREKEKNISPYDLLCKRELSSDLKTYIDFQFLVEKDSLVEEDLKAQPKLKDEPNSPIDLFEPLSLDNIPMPVQKEDSSFKQPFKKHVKRRNASSIFDICLVDQERKSIEDFRIFLLSFLNSGFSLTTKDSKLSVEYPDDLTANSISISALAATLNAFNIPHEVKWHNTFGLLEVLYSERLRDFINEPGRHFEFITENIKQERHFYCFFQGVARLNRIHSFATKNPIIEYVLNEMSKILNTHYDDSLDLYLDIYAERITLLGRNNSLNPKETREALIKTLGELAFVKNPDAKSAKAFARGIIEKLREELQKEEVLSMSRTMLYAKFNQDNLTLRTPRILSLKETVVFETPKFP